MILLLLLALSTAGCAFINLKKEVEYVSTSTVLVGLITVPDYGGDAPVVVAAYSRKSGEPTIVHYATLHEPGPYELMVPTENHDIVAFVDLNRNLVYDAGEPAGQILGTARISVPQGGVVSNLDIVVSVTNPDRIDFPVGTPLPEKQYTRFHSTCPGAIVDLHDPIFSPEFAEKGFWSPLEFFREFGGNVYFLEEYDPDKIPVLFVHGAAGTPRNWEAIIPNLDREKFQPWLFYYPSGASIDSMAYLLLWKLQYLQARYQFRQLYITAHSMGGLVSRSFLVDYGPLFPSITTFISISTPWGGEALAELGVKYAPAVVPSWRDIQPNSEFMDTIFRKEMPPGIDHYLIFGHRGNRNFLRPNNDQVVTLASQLELRSQREAKMIYGFDEDHMSILSSRPVIEQYRAILEEESQQASSSEMAAGNKLQVAVSFDFPEDLPRPMPALLLRPLGKEADETWIPFDSHTGHLEFGPFPSGKYEVSIFAPAFSPEPRTTVVEINREASPSVEISMKPIGVLRGYIVRSDPDFIQAGKFRKIDTDVEIQSITLTGSGIQRALVPIPNARKEDGNQSPLIPLQDQELTFSDYFLSNTDFALDGIFYFFDLPAGDYDLSITANGYQPYSQTLKVVPGDYRDTLQVELKKS